MIDTYLKPTLNSIQILQTRNSLKSNIPMETNQKKKRNGILGKGLIVLAITCALQIPILLVQGLIQDRSDLSNKAKEEISLSWGETLYVKVPELCIPFYVTTKDKDGKESKDWKTKKIKSSATDIQANSEVEILHRSIYDFPAYRADVNLTGSFKTKADVLENASGDIYITLPINNYKGLEGYPSVTVGGKEYIFNVVGSELRAVIPQNAITPDSVIDFSMKFKSKGMGKMIFCPLGTDYTVSLTSNHDSPSFKGDFLPTTRNVTNDGFDAKWEVTALNTCDAKDGTFGVDFILTADQYQQTERAMKYSFLFFILVLCSIFLVECITKSKVNIVQYGVTGLSLCLFYLLLLSISEYISFGWSYLIAAAMTTGALGGYFYGFLKSKIALAFTVATAGLYGYIYMLLQMESGSLLFGSVALFVILSIIMYFTRKKDMFETEDTSATTDM